MKEDARIAKLEHLVQFLGDESGRHLQRLERLERNKAPQRTTVSFPLVGLRSIVMTWEGGPIRGEDFDLIIKFCELQRKVFDGTKSGENGHLKA